MEDVTGHNGVCQGGMEPPQPPRPEGMCGFSLYTSRQEGRR
jgi:hypothetical protein